jgi:hypothetical protein
MCGHMRNDVAVAIVSWDHDEWQSWGLALVRERYGAESVVDIPDAAGGDHGVEAFTYGGIAFQCYCAENEPLAPTKRGALQKNKIGTDIKKFVDGGQALADVFGATVINTWVLLTPYHQDANVIVYCNGKAAEVMAGDVAYAADPFHVTVHHLDTYMAEHQVLLRRMAIEKDLIRPPDQALLGAVDYSETWSDLIEAMDTKLGKLPLLADPQRRARFRAALLEEQLQGGHLLDRWLDRVPDVATHIQHVLETAKRQLVLDSVGGHSPADLFQAVRAGLRAKVGAVAGLSQVNVEHVSDMALTNWLQECDLDFVEAADDE